MKKIWLSLVFASTSLFTWSPTYLDSLDSIIKEQVILCPHEDLIIIADQIESSIQNKSSLEKIYNLVHSKNVVSFFLLNDLAELEEVKFALGVKMYIYCLDCCEYKMLRKAMKIHDSLVFWKNERFCESRGLFQKNIGRWFSSSTYQNEVESKIKHLESLSHQILSCLGLVRYNKQNLLMASDHEEFEKKLMDAVQLQDMFVHHIKKDDYQVGDIYYVMKNMIQQLYVLNSQLSSQYIESQPPLHFERNRIAYTSAAVGLCSCAIAYYLYKDNVDLLLDNAYNSGLTLWNDQVQQPVEKLKNALLGTGTAPHFDHAQEDGICRSIVAHELRESAPCGPEISQAGAAVIQGWNYLGVANWFHSPDNIVQQQITPEQELLAQARFETSLTHPLKNIDSAMRAGEYVFLKGISDVKQQANVALKEMYEDNRLTIGIASLIPLMTVIAGGTFASKKIYNTVSYQPVRNIIRDLDIFLNNASSQEVSLDREGKLYFLTELLKKNSQALAEVDMKLIEEDIVELQSMTLTYGQKFNVVRRMYHTYQFLLPGAV